MLQDFKDYYSKAKMMQEFRFENGTWSKHDVNDDLVWNVPIYDVVNRRFAAFSSLLEAIRLRDRDPKGNGVFFSKVPNVDDIDFIKLCYLFRLCGSGINYKPMKNEEEPFGTHGFGNFWVVDRLIKGETTAQEWLLAMPEKGFCDVKGYLLPMIKQGLRWFILNESMSLVEHLVKVFTLSKGKIGIKTIVDKGNQWLVERGYKRQNFVLTAFAMDLAEYFPWKVDQDSDVYVGTNAKKCLKLIMPGVKTDKALRHLCDITGGHSKPYDMEDVACDFIRYIENFQSPHHIELNNGIKYENNVRKQTEDTI